MSDTISYKLKSPITIDGGARLESVTLREPLVDDMMAAEEDGVAGESYRLVHLLSRMAGLTVEQFRKVSSRDALAMKKLADAEWGNDLDQDGANSPS